MIAGMRKQMDGVGTDDRTQFYDTQSSVHVCDRLVMRLWFLTRTMERKRQMKAVCAVEVASRLRARMPAQPVR
jgi:hypothetical protein